MAAKPPSKAKKPAAAKPKAVKPKAPAKAKAAPKKKTDNELLPFILSVLDAEKVTDVVSIDLRGKTAIADDMVIASGTSSRQVTATAARLRDKLVTRGVRAKVEGQTTGDWVIVDAGSVIIHLFRPEVRGFYNLEKLWSTDFSTVGYNLYTSP